MKTTPKPLVSVIIITNGKRQQKLKNCLRSVLKNKYRRYEIVLIWQSTATKPVFRNKKIRAFAIPIKGTGYARNCGMRYSQGSLFLFTDDDCIVVNDWISNVAEAFQLNTDVSSVFGRVMPHLLTKKNGYICPSVVKKNKFKIFKLPVLHTSVGSGNNMAFRRSLVNKIGGFQEDLGLGSLGFAGEEVEYIFRILTSNYRICYLPTSVVYHDRWLTRAEYKKLMGLYICGETASYLPYAFEDFDFAKSWIKKRSKILFWLIFHFTKQLVLGKKGALEEIYNTFLLWAYYIRGVVAGMYIMIIPKKIDI